MKTKLIFALIFTALFINTSRPAFAHEKDDKIYHVKVYSTDGKVHSGILKSADDLGLYLAKSIEEQGKFIPSNQLHSILIKSKKVAKMGITAGLTTGLITGAAGAFAVQGDNKAINISSVVGAAYLTYLGGVLGNRISNHIKERIEIRGQKAIYKDKLSLIKTYSAAR